MNATNWKPILYIALITATKYLEDRYFWNIDIVNHLKLFDIKVTNRYEHIFLNLLDFNIGLCTKEFESYYKWLVIYQKFIEKDEDKDISLKELKMNVDT